MDNLGSAAEIGLTTESTAVPVVFAEANGTDYTSRFIPDSAGYSIGYNAAQQLQLQTTTYPVTYAPGANGTGDSKTVNKEYNNALELGGRDLYPPWLHAGRLVEGRRRREGLFPERDL